MASNRSLNDLMQEFFAAATGNATDMGVDAALPSVSSVPGVNESTYRAGGTSAAPGAGTEIATLPGLGSAYYEVEIQTFITGTTVAAVEAINMRLEVNDGATATRDIILNSVPGTAGSNAVGIYKTRIALGTNAKLAVIANAAATAGSSYTAIIHATKLVYL